MKEIKDLRIIKFKPLRQIVLNGGSGQYANINIKYENNLNQIVIIPNWYTPESEQVKELKSVTRQMLQYGYYVIINEETINMFLKTLKEM